MLLQLLPITILPMVLSPSYDNGILLGGRDEQEGRMMLFAEHDDDHNHIRNHILTLIGFILLSTFKSIIIGALVGKKCFRTKCCMSRHFLKAWCNSKYRNGSYKHCSWSRFKNKNHDIRRDEQEHDQGTTRVCLGHRSSSLALNHHDDDQSKTSIQEEATTSFDDSPHCNSSLLNHNDHCHNRGNINHDRICCDRTETSSSATSSSMLLSSSSSSSLCFAVKETNEQSSSNRIEELTSRSVVNKISSEMTITSMASSLPLQTTSSPPTIMSTRKQKSSLLHLARLQDWNGMLMRLNTCKHPRKEARKRDGDGLLALHWVCSSLSFEDNGHDRNTVILDIVQELIKAYPQSVCELDMEGNTPLHYLLQQSLMQTNYADKIVQALLKQDHSLLTYRNIHGHTPLWYACKNLNHISSSVIQVLLQYTLPITNLIEHEGRHRLHVATDSSTNIYTPLSMAWKVALKDMRSKKRQIRMQQQQQQIQNMLEETRRPLPGVTRDSSQAWNNALLLLRTVYYSQNDLKCNENEFPMVLIATIQIKQTPIDVFDEILELYPHLVKQCDSQGHLPFMVALEKFSSEEKHRSIHIVQKLLDVYPEAIKLPSSKGQLPLVVALRNDMTWNDAIERILKLYYDVLWIKDPITKLYPFMLAAASFQEEEGKSQGLFSRLWRNSSSSSSRRSSSTASSSCMTDPSNEQELLMESVFDKAVASCEQEDCSSEEQPNHNVAFERKSTGSSSTSSTLTTEQQKSAHDHDENVSYALNKNNIRCHSSSSSTTSTNTSTNISQQEERKHELGKLNTVYQLLLACPEAVRLK